MWGVMMRAESSARRGRRLARRLLRRYRLLAWLAVAALAPPAAVWGVRWLGAQFVRFEDDSAATSTLVAGVLAAVLSMLGFWIAHQVHKWNQRNATIEVACRWNDGETSRGNLLVRKTFPMPWTTPPTEAELNAAFANDPNLRPALGAVLNHLDIVAMGVEEGIYTPATTQHLYGRILTDYFRHFNGFILRTHHTSLPPLTVAPDEPRMVVWWYLVRVGEEWTRERALWTGPWHPWAGLGLEDVRFDTGKA